MRKLTFEMTTDSRFDGENWHELAKTRNDQVREELGTLEGITLEYDRALRYEFPSCEQVRQRFYVTKTTKKPTWNSIMHIVNNIKPVPFDWI